MMAKPDTSNARPLKPQMAELSNWEAEAKGHYQVLVQTANRDWR